MVRHGGPPCIPRRSTLRRRRVAIYLRLLFLARLPQPLGSRAGTRAPPLLKNLPVLPAVLMYPLRQRRRLILLSPQVPKLNRSIGLASGCTDHFPLVTYSLYYTALNDNSISSTTCRYKSAMVEITISDRCSTIQVKKRVKSKHSRKRRISQRSK